ncbi:hypothetical protein PJI17_08915 [Mycobacterium kansasii]
MTFPLGPTPPTAVVGAPESWRAARHAASAAAAPATTTPATPAGNPISLSIPQAAAGAHEPSRSQAGPRQPALGNPASDAAMAANSVAGATK